MDLGDRLTSTLTRRVDLVGVEEREHNDQTVYVFTVKLVGPGRNGGKVFTQMCSDALGYSGMIDAVYTRLLRQIEAHVNQRAA